MSRGAAFAGYLEGRFRTSRSGSQIVVHDDCPFCGRFGKVYVDSHKGVGICFYCGQGFTGVSFVAEAEGVSRKAAAALLAGEGGVYESEYESGAEDVQQKPWWPVCEPIEGTPGESYMLERGFSASFCERMRVGWCGRDTRVGGKVYRTGNRVLIPIFDRSGEAAAWQARDVTGRSRIKYLTQPGADVSRRLYNIQAVRSGLPIIVCEGVMDVWGWTRAGFRNAVATFGKKISAAQVELLHGLNPSIVYIAWDGDAEREKYEFAEKHGHLFDIRVVRMRRGVDADEMDREEMAGLLAAAGKYSWEARITSQLSLGSPYAAAI